ncbi:hypothetical protein ACFQH6_18840 [Halobacteriaceae archaeon GCM10025711]
MNARLALASVVLLAALAGCAGTSPTEPATTTPTTATTATTTTTTTDTTQPTGLHRTESVLDVEANTTEPVNVTVFVKPPDGDARNETITLDPGERYRLDRDGDEYVIAVYVADEPVVNRTVVPEHEQVFVEIQDESVDVETVVV